MRKGRGVIDPKLLESGVAIVLIVLVIAPMLWILRNSNKTAMAMVQAIDNMRVSSERQSAALRALATEQKDSATEVRAINDRMQILITRLDGLPKEIREQVIGATDDFLVKLTVALKQASVAPANFSPNGNQRPVSILRRIMGG